MSSQIKQFENNCILCLSVKCDSWNDSDRFTHIVPKAYRLHSHDPIGVNGMKCAIALACGRHIAAEVGLLMDAIAFPSRSQVETKALGAGAPLSIPSVLRSSSISSQ